jgi:hypothetical protein
LNDDSEVACTQHLFVEPLICLCCVHEIAGVLSIVWRYNGARISHVRYERGVQP